MEAQGMAVLHSSQSLRWKAAHNRRQLYLWLEYVAERGLEQTYQTKLHLSHHSAVRGLTGKQQIT